ncbi:hypothetical protein I3760_16G056100 [Carya illinoinensis]|nr:hypothetical protein I3760_16G056100 [Carya illinoinensis]
MDLLPLLNKVFSLVLQKEQQREISIPSASSHDNHAFTVKYDTNRSVKPVFKKEHPMCKHCGLVGHVIEKCFKLHSFPPGYKFMPRQQSMANQVVSDNISLATSPISLTESQYQQLLAMLQPSDPVTSNAQHTANAVSSTSFVPIASIGFSHIPFVYSSNHIVPTNHASFS